MERRHFVKALAALGMCPLCAQVAKASAGDDWSYADVSHWGEDTPENAVCATGTQQSPVDIVSPVRSDLAPIAIDWIAGAALVNNGHTIVANVPEGGRLVRGNKTYDLLQYHFHAPSEHKVEGEAYPMEVHFVHKDAKTGDLGVFAVFLVPGGSNATFSRLAAAFPAHKDQNVDIGDLDPSGLLPGSLGYWLYEGSLTTPPCTEVVDWMVAMESLAVDQADIDRFTAIYSGNARPVRPLNRRYILASP